MEYNLLKVYKRISPMGIGKSYTWKHVEMVDIRKGDVFTMIQPDGRLVEYKGEIVLYAMSDTFLDEDIKAFVVEMTSLKEWRKTNEKA
jgi:hypothetical protein